VLVARLCAWRSGCASLVDDEASTTIPSWHLTGIRTFRMARFTTPSIMVRGPSSDAFAAACAGAGACVAATYMRKCLGKARTRPPSYRARTLSDSLCAHRVIGLGCSPSLERQCCARTHTICIHLAPLAVAPQALRGPRDAELCIRNHAGCEGCGRLVAKALTWHSTSNPRKPAFLAIASGSQRPVVKRRPPFSTVGSH
jgi:hypothetical protein